ncbi:MAG: bifunctional hydroxymethylpyrimidine kinase/phosphomethylpyrimidine kinase [bacterium]|nr:bifunctional hydroxymethylpyrimidine kinase/phosphomethylpyrimidine kinase [bacterium]
MTQEKHYARALTIAGSDSGGGAGIQADLKTFAANGCYGVSVITALTAQNTVAVRSIFAVPIEMVRDQMEAVLTDIGADAVKIGMLFSPLLIRTVAEGLRTWAPGLPVVLDPVMVAQSGDKLLKQEAVAALKEELIPLAHLITPNLPEAEVLLGRAIATEAEMEAAARDLAGLGSANALNVLIKGGHMKGTGSDDLLYLGAEQRLVRFPGERIHTRNNHGTGCTLSSAIAAGIAKGLDLAEAVGQAKTYISAAIRAGADYRIGQGHGPVHHFHAYF